MQPNTDRDAGEADLEEHPSFPSGPWVGWFQQGRKYPMEVRMTFRNGTITAEGCDAQIGKFTYRGRYSIDDGRCYWTKTYLRPPYGVDQIFYKGFNEGKGIWGLWELPAAMGYLGETGRFFLRPEGWPDPWSDDDLKEAMDLPAVAVVTQFDELLEPVGPR
jgi:hypothetical protein